MKHEKIKSPPSLLIEAATYWSEPWLLQIMAQQGRSHFNDGRPIEDAHVLAHVGDSILLAVADGVGSAKRGGEGARAAVAVLGHALSGIAHPDAADLKAGVAAAHAALVATCPQTPNDVATTFAAVLITPKAIHALNIGDSNIVSVTENAAGELCLAPFCVGNQSSKEGTASLTDPAWADHAGVVTSHPDLLTGLILATDGAQSFFMRDMGLTARSTLDDTVIRALPVALSKLTSRGLSAYFTSFMSRADYMSADDRTLLMAFKPSTDVKPPQPKKARTDA